MITRLITRFADDMARELDDNDHKSGWRYMSVRQLLARAEQEMGELRRAVENGESFERVRSEAADVGNFLAMLVWVMCDNRTAADKNVPFDRATREWGRKLLDLNEAAGPHEQSFDVVLRPVNIMRHAYGLPMFRERDDVWD